MNNCTPCTHCAKFKVYFHSCFIERKGKLDFFHRQFTILLQSKIEDLLWIFVTFISYPSKREYVVNLPLLNYLISLPAFFSFKSVWQNKVNSQHYFEFSILFVSLTQNQAFPPKITCMHNLRAEKNRTRTNLGHN